jgi:hypothetical protein
MGVFKQVGEYLFIKKRDPDDKPTGFTKAMHGINRITIFMFLLCMIILAVKLLRH